ncbi:hypothetical protein ARTHRO9V_180042 [Arthrobacter sp. 9V]|nr:hypothetical protein ARTHRO9V_180042 [Arthrobacter sp. 9V]
MLGCQFLVFPSPAPEMFERYVRTSGYSIRFIEHIFEPCYDIFSTYQRTVSRLARTNV